MSLTDTSTPAPAAPLYEKFQTLQDFMATELFERSKEIWTGVVALLAGVHHFQLGGPGTGKTMFVDLLTKHIAGLEHHNFRWLMTAYTTPEELFGMPKFSAMKADRYERNTEHKLPEARVAFLDEIFKCLAGDTLILLPDGTRRPIAALASKPEVLSLKDGELSPTRPTGWGERPPERLMRLTLSSGQSLRTTFDHRVWARRAGGRFASGRFDWTEPSWIEAEKLRPGDFVGVPNEMAVFGDQPMNGSQVDLLAFLLSEGGLTTTTVRLTNADPVIVEAMKECVAAEGDTLVSVDDYSYRCVGPKQRVRSFIQERGLHGIKSPKRWIPEEVFRLPKPQLAQFIGRLWSCDGSVAVSGEPKLRYATSSPILAENLQHLLRRFGVASKRFSYQTKTPSGRVVTAWRVEVHRAYYEAFAQTIGSYLMGEKQLMLQTLDLVPKVSDRRLRRDGAIQWEQVISVEEDGHEPTYCFTTPTENFVAADIVVHNSNSAILNALLTILNERLFFNNGTPTEVPLSTLYCASNEMPRGSELAALGDRIGLRVVVNAPRERSSKLAIMKAKLARLAATLPPQKIVTWDEVLTAQAEVHQVVIPDVVLERMIELEFNLNKEGIEPTPRRINECLPAIQANAWMMGRTEADNEDLKICQHMLWTEPGSQQTIVTKEVLALADPVDREAMDILEMIESLTTKAEEILRDPDTELKVKRAQGVELHKKLDRCGKDLVALKNKAGNSARRTDKLDEANSRLTRTTEDLLSELFNIQVAGDPA